MSILLKTLTAVSGEKLGSLAYGLCGHIPTSLGCQYEGSRDTVKTLERLKSKWKIQYYGLSNFGQGNMKEFKEAGGKPITNQLPYNLLWRAVEYEAMPMCQEEGISILPYSPLAQGLLSGRFTKPEDVPEGRRRTRHFSNELNRHGQKGAEKETFQAIEAIRGVCQSAGISMPAASLVGSAKC
eukprot:m.270822 g.270822  ORF g.270822 m.270822 type:complete len:183 (+) comp40544_c2_seq31:721-1269(+)